jgi:hypothetical protein
MSQIPTLRVYVVVSRKIGTINIENVLLKENTFYENSF